MYCLGASDTVEHTIVACTPEFQVPDIGHLYVTWDLELGGRIHRGYLEGETGQS